MYTIATWTYLTMFFLEHVQKNTHMMIFTLSILKSPDTRSACLKSVDLIARKILLFEYYNENYFLQ